MPNWHKTYLKFKHLQGMELSTENSDEGFDQEMGVLMLNFIADFWDLIEQYKLLTTNKTISKRDLETKSRPSCSVIIKHLPEREDVFFAHNTWHEYRAMAYR